jgi:hypothetical protein
VACLGRAAAKAGNEHKVAGPRVEPRRSGLGCEFQHRRIQANLRLANRKLRGMHADGQTAGSRIDIVADEPALTTFIPPAVSIESERQGRDDLAGA